MKKTWQFILVITLLVSLSSISLASRVLTAPTGDLLGSGQAELDFHYLRKQGSLEFNLGLHPRFNLGVRQYFGSSLVGTAKFGLFTETKDRPALALGGEFGLHNPSVYFAVSKQLGAPGLRGHLAWGSGRYSKGRAGVGLVLNPVQTKTEKGWTLPTSSVVLEYDGLGLNGALVAQFTPEFEAYIATSFSGDVGLGLNYKVAF